MRVSSKPRQPGIGASSVHARKATSLLAYALAVTIFPIWDPCAATADSEVGQVHERSPAAPLPHSTPGLQMEPPPPRPHVAAAAAHLASRELVPGRTTNFRRPRRARTDN